LRKADAALHSALTPMTPHERDPFVGRSERKIRQPVPSGITAIAVNAGAALKARPTPQASSPAGTAPSARPPKVGEPCNNQLALANRSMGEGRNIFGLLQLSKICSSTLGDVDSRRSFIPDFGPSRRE
jgi:hypothetical protein